MVKKVKGGKTGRSEEPCHMESLMEKLPHTQTA
jgi:hypothetical protein